MRCKGKKRERERKTETREMRDIADEPWQFVGIYDERTLSCQLTNWKVRLDS